MTEQTTVDIAGHRLTITRPSKLLWPAMGITKLEYLTRLAELAPYLLRYCRDRYLTAVRCPDGVGGQSFYQKNCPRPAPPFVRTARHGDVEYVVPDSLPTLLWLGNLACLEFHVSFHRVGDELPAEWIIDIDPPGDREPRLARAALLVGETLDRMNVRSVPKTSGASGIQIWVPIRRGYTFEQLRSVGRFVGEYLVRLHSDLFTVARRKADRGNRIYIDYLQHWRGKTLAAPYTPRATPFAGVSMPLTWDEIERGADPREFNLRTARDRLERTGDLLAATPPQSLDHVLDALGAGSPAARRTR